MCGRFTLTTNLGAIAQRFGVTRFLEEVGPRYNIAPSQTVIVVGDDGQRNFVQMQWGLIPSWAKDPGIGSQMINAQAETVATKPAFRAAFRKRRCLILADGFYEWARQGHQKQPYYIRLRDGRPFAIAGLWEHWEGAGGTPIDSCTLLTIAANDLIGTFHHRMPVIQDPGDFDLWLDPRVQDTARLQALLRPFPAERMTAYPVSTWVNNPAHDTPDCIAPVP